MVSTRSTRASKPTTLGRWSLGAATQLERAQIRPHPRTAAKANHPSARSTRPPFSVKPSKAAPAERGVSPRAGEAPALLAVDIDPERLRDARLRLPVLANRRFAPPRLA